MLPASSFERPAEALKARTAVAGVAAVVLLRAAWTAARIGRTRDEDREAMAAETEGRESGGGEVVAVAVGGDLRSRTYCTCK